MGQGQGTSLQGNHSNIHNLKQAYPAKIKPGKTLIQNLENKTKQTKKRKQRRT